MPKTDITVQELISKVQHGDLTLPEMQRRYVWPSTRVRDLLDSLYRSYPSGSILVWETEDSIETRELAVGTDNSSPTTSQKLLLLDGQQRITSLAAVLNDQPIIVKNRKRPIDILFNLDHPEGPPSVVLEVDENESAADLDLLEEQSGSQRDIQQELKMRTFVVSSPVLRTDHHWVSVSDIFTKSDRDLLKPLGINSDDEIWDKYSDRLQRVRAIRDYQYVMQVLTKDMSYEEVTEIFVRVNSLGAKLRSSDLALAQITSKWRGFMDLLEEFAGKFGDDADYITEWVAVRMLTVCATKQAKFKTVGRVSQKDLEKAWEQAKRGINFAVNFLRNNANVESLYRISSSMLIIPIALYAILNNETLSPSEEKKMLTWFYYAHMRGHYGAGSSEGILNADLAILFDKSDLDALIHVLRNHVKRFEVTPEDLAGKNTNSPFFSMLFMILKADGASDWITGLKLSDKSVGISHTIQYHHIFPKSLLQKVGSSPRDTNDISNLSFICGKTNRRVTNKTPDIYLEKEIVASSGEAPLALQLVPLDRSLWKMENYHEFLNARRRLMANRINSFMKNIAEPETVTPLQGLMAKGESAKLEFKPCLRQSLTDTNANKHKEDIIIKSVAAFSNSDGGTLLIGIDDRGRPIGLTGDYKSLSGDKDKFEVHLRNLLNGTFGEGFVIGHIKITFPIVNDIEICRVDVAKGTKPFYVKREGVDRFYVRSGNTSTDMPISEVSDYIDDRF